MVNVHQPNNKFTKNRYKKHNTDSIHNTQYTLCSPLPLIIFNSNQIKFELGKIRMMPGTYAYRFQFIIPPHVPSSVEGSVGHIRYTACLTIDIPMFQSKEFQQTFYVLKSIDLNNYPMLRVSFLANFSEFYLQLDNHLFFFFFYWRKTNSGTCYCNKK